MSADSSGHVKLIQAAQSLADGEQAAVQAFANDALKLCGRHVGRDVDHCANGRRDAEAANRGDVGFRDVVVVHDDLLVTDSNSLARAAVRLDEDVILWPFGSHWWNVAGINGS